MPNSLMTALLSMPDSLMAAMFVLYCALIIGLVAFTLSLVLRFVKAHERMAGALEEVARKIQPGSH